MKNIRGGIILTVNNLFDEMEKIAMKHSAGLILLFAVLFAVADVYAKCGTLVKRTNVGGRIKFSGTCGTAGSRRVSTTDISGHMRRLEEELEEIDEKLSRINPDGKTALNFRHKREVASLKLIQMIQRLHALLISLTVRRIAQILVRHQVHGYLDGLDAVLQIGGNDLLPSSGQLIQI